MTCGPRRQHGRTVFQPSFIKKVGILLEKTSPLCLRILNGDMEVSAVDSTNIVLIPKVVSPTNMTWFLPISLCHVLYKILAKVLANRLRVIGKCIDDAQSAFVPED